MKPVTVRRTPLHHTKVTAVEELTQRMRRITLTGASLKGVEPRPAQDVELIINTDEGRRVKRRYTIRYHRSELGEWDVDAVLHGHGPGAIWAAGAQVGDEIDVLGPRGKIELRPADWYLFVGDESAIPAFASLIEALPAGLPAICVVEITDADDELPLADAKVDWIHRREVPPGGRELLERALDDISPEPGQGHAFLLGESRAMVALRPAVRDLGIGDADTYLKGYWNVGRSPRRIAAERGILQ